MPRDIPIGNGRLLINFDSSYQLRDFYYPHVGKENHSTGHPFRFGVWCEGNFSWVHSEEWKKTLKYQHETLVTDVTLENPKMKLRLLCNDAVDFHENVYIKRVVVENLAEHHREVRLFFSHDFHISESEIGDTAYFRPDKRALVHYKGQRYFFINCCTSEKCGFDQYATGIKESGGAEGTWRDAEDGILGENPIAQGSVDSTAALHLTVPAKKEAEAIYWITCGTRYEETKHLHHIVLQKTPHEFLKRTANYWKLWVNKEEFEFFGLDESVVDQFKKSLLILRTQIDEGGAIIAANDSDIVKFGRDMYSYMWPRDGALVAYALDLAGYSVITLKFFDFCYKIITEKGFFLHKYNPDGSLGSSWHPWVSKRADYLPIQEDETALVIWALWKHFEKFRDIEPIKPLYRGLIVRAANFLCDYRDEQTFLPLPSYDLWEERYGAHAFTVGAVYGGLMAAANFTKAFGETHLANRYRTVASEMKKATDKYLWRADSNRFARRLYTNPQGNWEVDGTIDSSLYGLFYFGMYSAEDAKIVATMESVQKRLWVQTPVGGVARYQNDYYHQVRHDTENVPGNPWFICTLWLAQWKIAQSKSNADLQKALDLIRWVVEHALLSGVLAEQIDPNNNQPLSVSPLTWSHATFVATVIEYLDKFSDINRCDSCHAPLLAKEWHRLHRSHEFCAL